MADVSVRNVQRSYDGVQAVRGVDIEIGDHEFVVLIGPSGSCVSKCRPGRQNFHRPPRPRNAGPAGDTLTLQADMNQIHLLDPTNGHVV